jgi:hypothetical protein
VKIYVIFAFFLLSVLQSQYRCFAFPLRASYTLPFAPLTPYTLPFAPLTPYPSRLLHPTLRASYTLSYFLTHHHHFRVALAQARGEEGYTLVFNIMVPGPPFYSFVVGTLRYTP